MNGKTEMGIMNRRSFIIWFVVFAIIQWPMMMPFPGIRSVEELVFTLVVWALLFSSVLGIVWFGIICYQCVPNIWKYLFEEDKWLEPYRHAIGEPGFSIERIFLLRDVLPLVLAFVIIVHLFLCVKRCRDAGISKWWVLVPLYNPIVLMIKKRNEEVSV